MQTHPNDAARERDASVLSREQMFAVLATADEGVTVQDPSLRLLYANPLALGLFDFASLNDLRRATSADVLARFQMIDERGAALDAERLPGRIALRSGRDADAVIVGFRKRGGELRWSVVRSTLIRSADGRPELVVNRFREITNDRRSERALRLLAEAGSLLSTSLDYEATFAALTRLVVPHLGDWCELALLEDGVLRQVAVAHVDPARVELARELYRRYPPCMDAPTGVASVLRTGKPEVIPEIPEAMLIAAAVDDEHLALLRELGLHAWMCVPLVARGRTLGALTLAAAETGKRFDDTDLAIAEKLASRAALACDNARLYRDATQTAARLAIALEAGEMGSWEWDLGTGRITWSEQVARLRGVSPGAFDGTFASYAQHMHPEDRDRVVAQIQDLVEHPRPEHHLLYRVVRTDGAVRWVEAHGRLICDDAGRPLRLVGVSMDVTARKEAHEAAEKLAAEHAAREAAERHGRELQAIVQCITDPFVVVDASDRITYLNDAIATFGGARAGALVGLPLWTALPVLRSVSGAEAAVAEARATREHRRFDAFLADPPRWFDVHVHAAGERVSLHFNDVTGRKLAEEELERRAKDLARSNADLERFAYVASHDLQEPLRMVASYTQLLARRYRGRLDAEADEFIAYAVDGVARMQTLIQDLLAFSRVETRGKPFAPVELDAALDRAIANLAASIDESDARIQREPLPRVLGDAGQLTQVFQNLVGNAIKFRSAAAPVVRVTAERGPHEVTLSVHDNGIGVAPEYAERIFVLFQRLHGRGEYDGNGIGLAMCKKIVERHGGRVGVDSRPGEGSRFWFTIPVAKEAR